MRHLLGVAALVALLSTSADAAPLSTRKNQAVNSNNTVYGLTRIGNEATLDIPARKMWGWGGDLSGYCGSMSFQMAGIFHGNYISQEQTRWAGGDQEILIGTGNEVKAAKKLEYDYSEWDWRKSQTPQSKKFVEWAKDEVDQGHVVITGWYERQPKGDEDYDHIMPIVGYKTDSSGDVDGLYHYDLYLNYLSLTSGANLHATRKECKQKESPVQPFDYCLPDDYDYAISVHGVKDPKGELYRTKLVAPTWWEPDYSEEDKLHETPVEFVFQAVISGLTKGDTYTILRFDSPDAVPSRGDFKAGSYGQHKTFEASGSTHTLDLHPIMSDGTFFYRTIKGSV